MKQIIKDTLILCAITLISGLLLGIVYNVTKQPIEVRAEKKKTDAYMTVFEDYLKENNIAKESVTFSVAHADWLAETDDTSNTVSDIAVGSVNGEVFGYVITVTNSESYNEPITLSVGILTDKTVSGVTILSIAETPGLGMKAKESAFLSQFANVNTGSFTFTKSGSTKPSEIDAISSATFTTRSVTNAVNHALAVFDKISLKEVQYE